MKLALVLWAALALALSSSAQSNEERAAALTFDPARLPRAAEGHWSAWKPSDELPLSVRDSMGVALAAYRESDYAAALVHLHGVLAREPDFPAALYQLGVTHFRLRRYGDGAKAFERFLAAAPGELGATQGLAHCYYSLGDYPRAQAHYERVLAVAAASAEAWRGLGLALLRQGDAQGGLARLDRALELKPDHADALAWRAQALFDLGRPGEALVPLLRSIELAPHEPRPWFLLAQVQSELGREEEAERARTQFRELGALEQEVRAQEGLLLYDPRAIEPLVRLLKLHRASRNSGELRDTLARALRITPLPLELAVEALDSADALGQRDVAVRLAAELEQRFSNTRAAWECLARHFAVVGDAARARQARERAAQL